MKLDPTVMRHMNAQDFRVMEAVEKGMKDHYLVPLPLLTALANLRHGGAHKIMSSLLRDKLLSHEKKNGMDGYRLTNAGYDILALHNLKSRGFVAALGQRIGTGKESDIYLAANKEGKQIVLKFHRLGRTSFRNIRKKRDYLSKKHQNQAHSWLFLSRLSALKEYAFMKALYQVKYPTPMPIAQNRHIVCMSLVRGIPLYQVYPKQVSLEQAADIYRQSVDLAKQLAQHGLVHCDLNEFNLLVDLSGIQSLATTDDDPYIRHSGNASVMGNQSMPSQILSKPAWEQSLEADDRIQLPEPAARLPNGDPQPIVTLIDFPQMISTQHPNAKELYERDIMCLKRFFELKLHLQVPADDPIQSSATWENVASIRGLEDRLDEELRASGSSNTWASDLELYYFQTGPTRVASAVIEEGDEEDDSEKDDNDESSRDDDEDQVDNEDDCFLVDSDEEDPAEVALSDGEETQTANVVEMMDEMQIEKMTRAQMKEKARARVKRQIEEAKRKNRTRGAFRKGNSNKTFVKGKRVMNDMF